MQLIVYGTNTLREAILSGNLKKGNRVYVSEKKWKTGTVDKSLTLLCKDKNIVLQAKNDGVFMKDYGKEAFAKGIASAVEYNEKTYEDLFSGVKANKRQAVNDRAPSSETGAAFPFYLILDEITDPQNFGSIIRTASCVGVSGIITPRSNSVFITPSVAYVSQGALFYVDAVRVPNISRVIEDLKKRGVWVAGLSSDAPDTIYGMDFNVPLAVVVGSEGNGLRRLTVEKCDRVLKIPMSGDITSLNASVSFAVAAYEVVRQRNYSGKINFPAHK